MNEKLPYKELKKYPLVFKYKKQHYLNKKGWYFLDEESGIHGMYKNRWKAIKAFEEYYFMYVY